MSNPKPFEGIRVIDLTTYIAAPTCGRFLADWGAEVIKVEPLKGEVWRPYGNTAYGYQADADENVVFDIFNANKKSVPLNLKEEKGKEIFHKLLATADVFLTNNRPQALKKMGLDYDSLKDKYPKLIFATVLGYGEKGPDKDDPGYDTIAFWSRSGFLADQSVPGGYPVIAPGGFGDAATGTTLFGAVAAALYNRTKTGKGDKVDVSLFGTALWFAGYTAAIAQPGLDQKYPKERYKGIALQTQYKTKDGEWIGLGIVDYARDFDNFCDVINKPEWKGNPEYNTRRALDTKLEAVIKELEGIFAQHDLAYWEEKLKAKDIVFTKLRHYKELLMDEQALANDYSFLYHYKSGNDRYMPRIPIHSEYVGVPDFKPAAVLGENTDEVLKSVGYSDAEIAALKEGNIVK